MKKSFILLNVFLTAAVVVGDVFYIKNGELFMKALTSIGFVLIGAVNFIWVLKKRYKTDFPAIMLAGLFLSMIADIVLNLNFIIGAAVFAMAHVFYFASYCRLDGFKKIDIIPCLLIFVPTAALILFAPIFEFESTVLQVVCLVYALIISFMVGKAFAYCFRTARASSFLIAFGSALFFFSDLMLLFDKFSNLSEITGILCLATYYPAQCLLAYSVFLCCEKTSELNKAF